VWGLSFLSSSDRRIVVLGVALLRFARYPWLCSGGSHDPALPKAARKFIRANALTTLPGKVDCT
jgi:hypothetical protein